MRVGTGAGAAFELFEQRNVAGLDRVGFVDLDLRVADLPLAWESLAEVPHRFADCDTIVFRWPRTARDDRATADIIEFLEEAELRATSIGSPTVIEVFAPVVGDAPLRVSTAGDPTVDLAALRSLEIGALLDQRGAHLPGDGFHFRLPSGQHADIFVRTANVFSTPRDVWALSSWIVPSLTNNCSLLLDSPTMTPVAVQLAAFAAEQSWQLGNVAILDHYPKSRVEVQQRVLQAANTGSCVAVLSMDSTGATRDSIVECLNERIPDKWTMHIVAKSEHSPDPQSDAISVWFSTAVAPNVLPCQSCNSHRRSDLVDIDAATYYPQPAQQPHTVVPSILVQENAGFWELADRRGAVLLEVLPSAEAQQRRAERTPLGVRVVFDRMIVDIDELRAAVRSRVKAIRGDTEPVKDRTHLRSLLTDAQACTIVYTEEPVEHVAAIRAVLIEIGLREDFELVFGKEALKEAFTTGHNILAFAWGALTGERMKLLRVAVSDACPDRAGHVGLCLHARPTSEREWRSAINSFRPGILGALWLSYLPWVSPLRTEREMLSRLHRPSDISDSRLLALENDDEKSRLQNPLLALWGVGPPWQGQPSLRPTSVYGNQLSTNVAYAAVGAALQLRRVEESKPVRRLAFDLGNIGAPYFDATLVASILRWIRPSEAWWGADRAEHRGTLDKLWEAGGQTEDELAVMIPEFYLAAAVGKFSNDAFERLEERWMNYLDNGGYQEGDTAARNALVLEARQLALQSLGRG